MSKENINEIVSTLEDLQEDKSVPKNVRIKIDNTIRALKEDTEMSVKIHKALHELEDAADDANLEAFTRTQIWNVISLLEKV